MWADENRKNLREKVNWENWEHFQMYYDLPGLDPVLAI